jgi:hypothetical protein
VVSGCRATRATSQVCQAPRLVSTEWPRKIRNLPFGVAAPPKPTKPTTPNRSDTHKAKQSRDGLRQRHRPQPQLKRSPIEGQRRVGRSQKAQLSRSDPSERRPCKVHLVRSGPPWVSLCHRLGVPRHRGGAAGGERLTRRAAENLPSLPRLSLRTPETGGTLRTRRVTEVPVRVRVCNILLERTRWT